MSGPSLNSSVHQQYSSAAGEWAWATLIVLLGGILRLYRLDFQSLWYDEGLQYYVARHFAIGEMFSQTNSFHPPLSFLINRAFLLVGDTDFVLRLPSALFGIGSLPLFYVLAKKLTSVRNAVVCTFILAISPFHIWYSQDARMYSQLLFFSLLSSVVLVETLKRQKRRWWVYYTLVSVAGLYTHVFMLLALAAQFLWVLFYRRRDVLWLGASGITAGLIVLPWVVLLPWIGNFVRRIGESTISSGSAFIEGGSHFIGRPRVSWEGLPYTLFVYSGGFSLGPTVAELHENRSLEFLLGFLPTISVVGTIYLTLLIAGIVAMYKQFGQTLIALCSLAIVVSFLAAGVYSLAPRASFNVRYTIVAFPYFCLLIGTGLVALTRINKVVGLAGLLGVVSVSSVSLSNYFANPRYAREDVKSAVAVWRTESSSELLLSHGARFTIGRYLDPLERKRHFQLPGPHNHIMIKKLLSRQNSPSVYVLLARDWKEIQEQAIRKTFRVVEEQAFPGVTLFKISNNGR